MKDDPDSVERRAAVRVRAIYPLAYAQSEESLSPPMVHAGRTLDISETGMQIETHGLLTRGQRLKLEIALGERIIQAKGEVLYVEPLAHGQCATGIRFTSIGDGDLAALREAIG